MLYVVVQLNNTVVKTPIVTFRMRWRLAVWIPATNDRFGFKGVPSNFSYAGDEYLSP